MKRVFAINLGSTSTKVAYAEDDRIVYRESISHTKDGLEGFSDFFEQMPMRMRAVEESMDRNGVDKGSLDAIVARGGMLQPMPVGVFEVNEAMVDQLQSGAYGMHPSSMGCVIARRLADELGCCALTVDVPSSDELLPVARYSGLPGIWRRTMTQTLNERAVVAEWAASQGLRYEDVNAITVGLGGGINIIPHCHGRMIDTNNSVDGEGCFSTNRCLTVPIDELIADCYSGRWTYKEMMRRVSAEGGLVGYLGTADMLEIEARVNQGDDHAREVVDAMCYQIGKDVGAFATTMRGDVDVIILTGGMARSNLVTSGVTRRVEWIAPVVIRPGELEMEALCQNAVSALEGELPIQTFVPAKTRREAMDRIDETWRESCWSEDRPAALRASA